MDTKTIKQSVLLPTSPKEVFEAWMDSKKHGEMVEGNAKIDPKVGGSFSIWDGAITGKTLEINSTKLHIVQSWRYEYDDWPKGSPSTITLDFEPDKNGRCRLNLLHTGVPAKYADEISKGWKDYYWEPMKKYFRG